MEQKESSEFETVIKLGGVPCDSGKEMVCGGLSGKLIGLSGDCKCEAGRELVTDCMLVFKAAVRSLVMCHVLCGMTRVSKD